MRVFTVLGPSHSGKTTLVEALSGLEGHGMKGEMSDAVTVRRFSFLGDEWGAIDIAGSPDHLATAGQALAASDAALLCVPPEPDAVVLAAPYLRLIEASGTPCVLFINKMDTATERVRDIVSALQAYSNHAIVLRQVPIRDGSKVIGAVDLVSERAWKYREGQPSDLIEIPDQTLPREQEARTELLEQLSDFDDTLLEQLIEDKRPATEEVFDVATRVEQRNEIIPAMLGAAGHGNGVHRLMKLLRHEVAGPAATRERIGGEPLAVGVLADIRRHLGKTVVLRALAGGVRHGAGLGGQSVGSLVDLDGKSALGELAPGQLGIAVKSDHLAPGYAYTADAAAALEDRTERGNPVYCRIAAPVHEKDDVRLSGALSKLEEIDPGLRVDQDQTTGRLIICSQGPLHTRRLTAKLAEDFGIEIEEAQVPPQYRETISKPVEHHHRHRKQSGGAGQFADVVMDIRPAARGAGFSFDEVVKGGAVPRNYIPAVETGVVDALSAGPRGFPVIDVAVTLKDGKHHSVDSSDFAFRAAGKNCIREAIGKAGPLLLQPIDHVDIHVPTVFSGALVPVISSLKGHVLGFENHPSAKGWDVFSALLPASARDELLRSLASATQGTAWVEVSFDHFEEMHGKESEQIRADSNAVSA